MGLDARVNCNCFVEGRTTQPPVLREQIAFDEDGYLSLLLPYDGNEELYDKFDSWMVDACEHANMATASVWVANWWQYRAFVALLERLGLDRFPTLRAELPVANGGSMSPGAANIILKELDYFQEADLGSVVLLVDSISGEELHNYYEGANSIFIWSDWPGVNLGLDEHGFFITSSARDAVEVVLNTISPPQLGPYEDSVSKQAKAEDILFRAIRFEQHLLEPELTRDYKHGLVEFVDVDTAARFKCRNAVSKAVPCPDGRKQDSKGRVCQEFPQSMHVTRRTVTFSEFESIVAALREVCHASLRTGNPIIWARRTLE